MNKHLLFIDFETFWESRKGGYGLRQMSMIEYVRDPRFKAFGMGVCSIDSQPEWISAKNIPMYIDLIADQIGWPNVAVVGHNIKFDGTILKEIYEVVPGQYIDTKGMSKAVLAKSAKSHHLADLAEHFKLQAKGTMKTDGLTELTPEQEAELSEYCLHDVWLCRELYKKLSPGFPENQYAPMHRTVDMFVNPKVILNVPLLQTTAKEEAERRKKIFEEIGIDKKTFASNAKFPELLKARGFEVPTKTSPRTGKVIPALALGDTEFLEMTESENEELRTLCEARIAAKSTLLETRSTKLASIGATGPWPFDVEFSGADQTHRFSGGGGAGGNPQNFTKNSALRRAVEAPRGHSIVVGDFSNIELRIVAYLSKDAGLVQAIEQNTDIYCDFASVFFGRRITKADKAERQFGKVAILGLGYGMGWEKFIKTVRVHTGQTISEADSKKAIELYRTRYAGVPRLWDALDNVIPTIANTETRRSYMDLPVRFAYQSVALPSGLMLRYPNLREELNERGHPEWVYDVYRKKNLEHAKLYGGKLLENISQALAGELCKEAMLKMGDAVTGLVHDEIHVLCKQGLELVTAQKLKRAMSISPAWMPKMRLAAEVHTGKSWGSCK